jgi:hypothetical protein
MNHLIGFDPYTIGRRNRRIRAETGPLGLRERPRKNRKVSRSFRPFAAVERVARWDDPISPGHGGPQTASPDGFVPRGLAGGGGTSWT